MSFPAVDRRRSLTPLIGWGAAGVLALLLRSDQPTVLYDYSELVLAGLSTAFGVWVFWTHGRQQITAAGVYCLAVSVFVGFAGLWWWAQPGAVDQPVYIGTMTGYWTTYAMWALFWRHQPNFALIRHASPEATQWAIGMGLVVAVVGSSAGFVSPDAYVQFPLAGLSLVAVGLILHRAQHEKVIARLGVAGLTVLVFWETVFTGFGRLNLVAIALVGIVVASGRRSRRTVKAMVLTGVSPALWLLILTREALPTTTGITYDGIGSVVYPVRYFGELVQGHASGLFAFSGGQALEATLTVWIPRSWWPGKPEGFGAVLTPLLAPATVGTNNSLAAHAYGEWYFDFGWAGVIVMVLFLGVFIWAVDRLLARATATPLDTRRQLVPLVVAVLLVVDMPNLMWVGTFGYVARTAQRLAILGFLALPFAARHDRSQAAGPEDEAGAATAVPAGSAGAE
jgi:hypothetical protein